MADFRERRALFASGQRRFLAVVGPCLIAAVTCIMLSAVSGRGEPYPTGVALLLVIIAAALMPVDRDHPGPKLVLYGVLCLCVFMIFVVL